MSTPLPGYMSSFGDHLFGGCRLLTALSVTVFVAFFAVPVAASDWDEDSPKKGKTKAVQRPVKAKENRDKAESAGGAPAAQDQSASKSEADSKSEAEANGKSEGESSGKTARDPAEHKLEGKVEQAEEASLRIQRPGSDDNSRLRYLAPQPDKPDSIEGQIKDAGPIKGSAHDSAFMPMNPLSDASSDPLQGKAILLDGKGAKSHDPDEDDVELMVEWDRWHNRFLRAVQLGTQEILNNPEPEDLELRADPRSSNFTSRYPLGIGAAFSCVVTAEGQIKNLQIFEPSGFPKYDRAVLRAVQQLSATQLLHFPRGSHRRTVIQPGRIKTGNNSDFKYYHFGDVERVRQP